MEYNPDELSKRLRELRKSNGYTQEQLAKMLCVESKTYQKHERKKKPTAPPLGRVIKLSEIYEVSTDYILTGKETSVLFEKVANHLESCPDNIQEYILVIMERLLSLFKDLK